MTLSSPKAIIFDWDNTLVDTWPTIHHALTVTFEEMGKTPWSLAETKRRVHRSLRDAFPPIFGDRWQEAGDIYLRTFLDIHLEKLTPLPFAEELLETLTQRNICLTIVSNKTGTNLRKEVACLRWDHHFHRIIGATDAIQDKPSIAPVEMALDESGVSLEDEIWFIGDSLTDMECAHRCHCTPIFFGDHTTLQEECFQHYQPAISYHCHSDFINDIKRLT